ncbi:MAG: prepilin-type N-terminal cleavage/methylation domain-containing protein [Deltaproteobacteria bacterium]|nr:prepilin-type N-terminal cleavage/methylation domain-containing protein [Deltaproteobacteria bacterium]
MKAIKRKQIKGFTLIELMIAMAVMAFGILGYSFLNSRALQNRTFSRDLNRAAVVAERFAESLSGLDYKDNLLIDDKTDTAVTDYPNSDLDDGDTGTIFDLTYTITTQTTSFDTKKWYQILQENQRYFVRWEVLTGNSDVTGTPEDDIKIIKVFTAFEKKDPKNNTISIGGYNPVKLGPNVLTFKMDR